jgi:hypothetical protein
MPKKEKSQQLLKNLMRINFIDVSIGTTFFIKLTFDELILIFAF